MQHGGEFRSPVSLIVNKSWSEQGIKAQTEVSHDSLGLHFVLHCRHLPSVLTWHPHEAVGTVPEIKLNP